MRNKYFILGFAVISFNFSCDNAYSLDVTQTSNAPSPPHLLMKLVGRGTVTYQCRLQHGDFHWVPTSDHCELYNSRGLVVGFQSDACWELDYGGEAKGRITDSEQFDNKGIRSVIFHAVEARGFIMGRVKKIQKVNIVGGSQPDEPANFENVGKERKIQFAATYLFFDF